MSQLPGPLQRGLTAHVRPTKTLSVVKVPTLQGERDIEGRRPQAHRELLRIQGFTGHQQDVDHAQAGLLQAGDEGAG